MGWLIDGKWSPDGRIAGADGEFKRKPTSFREWIRADGSTPYAPEAGRYHLYASYACPWANRVLIVRALKGLESAIDVSITHPFMGEDGWTFDEADGVIPDPVSNARYLHDIYRAALADYTGRVTVPVLWDKQRGTIVNNESSELIEMLDHEFGDLASDEVDLFPVALREEIQAVITAIYSPINNGVYRAGFANSQEAHEKAVVELFAALDHWEQVLSRQRYLCGAVFTAADICMFTTLIRFDPVYNIHFKCNLRRLTDYPNLWAYTRDLYSRPAIRKTVDMQHIRCHYFTSHESVSPRRLIPLGPILDYDEPHGRERLG